MPPTDPRELLKAYSGKQVTADQVMRGLAPIRASMFRRCSQRTGCKTWTRLIGRMDSRWACLAVCSAVPLIFAALDDRFEAVSTNPCSPQEESWLIKRDGFSLTDLWGKVVELEDAVISVRGHTLVKVPGRELLDDSIDLETKPKAGPPATSILTAACEHSPKWLSIRHRH